MTLTFPKIPSLPEMMKPTKSMDWTKRDYDYDFGALDFFEKGVKEMFAQLGKPNGLSEIAKAIDNLGVARVNVKSVTGGTEYEVEAPGYDREDFQVEVVEGQLCISAEQKAEAKEDTDAYTRREFVSASFKRAVSLPPGVSPEAITAKYDNGILRVFVPVAVNKEKSLIKVL